MGQFITINGHTIRHNANHKTEEPPIRVSKTKSSKPDYTSHVAIVDDQGNEVAWLEYQPHKPQMSCGARLVLRTKNDTLFTKAA